MESLRMRNLCPFRNHALLSCPAPLLIKLVILVERKLYAEKVHRIILFLSTERINLNCALAPMVSVTRRVVTGNYAI